MGGVRLRVRLIRRFSRFSTAQAYSPILSAPTMRPLPLSVWNERRTVISVSTSSGESSHEGRCRLIDAISSLASSINNSRISGSICSASGATTGNGMTSVACICCAAASASSASARCPSASTSSASSFCVTATGACSSSGSTNVVSCMRFSTSRSTVRQASALSSMYQGSLRPALTVSM